MSARVSTSEKIRQIVHDIDLRGNAPLTRLMVLKKWLEAANRLPALGLWIASQAATDNAGKEPEEAALIEKARVCLQGLNEAGNRDRRLNRRSIEALQKEASQYKREFRGQQWGPVRVVNSWPLYLIEACLALVLEGHPHPSTFAENTLCLVHKKNAVKKIPNRSRTVRFPSDLAPNATPPHISARHPKSPDKFLPRQRGSKIHR
jgi:hypothetical protein